tara:strand:+ start:2791 stop:3750 length:960 start_codon:yes stop_codon:yes gene_type:complete
MINPDISLDSIYEAAERISPYIIKTPLHTYPGINKIIATDVFIKHENHQSIGSFKIRGALNYLLSSEIPNGVIVASTGNFGQGVAFAGQVLGVKVKVVVPKKANTVKLNAMTNLDAEIIEYGNDFDQAREKAEQLSKDLSWTYIHSANEPMLIAGVGTYTLEILQELSDVDVIIVPVGGGSGVCGACITAKSMNPKIKIIGVQAKEAPAAYESWKTGNIQTYISNTRADGLATNFGYELTQQIMKQYLDDFLLVSEEDMINAVFLYLKETRNLAEYAGSASLAAAINIKDVLVGKKTVLVLSGGNITMKELQRVIALKG